MCEKVAFFFVTIPEFFFCSFFRNDPANKKGQKKKKNDAERREEEAASSSPFVSMTREAKSEAARKNTRYHRRGKTVCMIVVLRHRTQAWMVKSNMRGVCS